MDDADQLEENGLKNISVGSGEGDKAGIIILSRRTGNHRISYDNKDPMQVSAAKILFERLVAEGLTPYKIGQKGEGESKRMKEFDPDATDIIFVPMAAISGG